MWKSSQHFRGSSGKTPTVSFSLAFYEFADPDLAYSAHVLASPPRQCRNTFLILPSSLLITLHARPHPDTLDPWLLPVNLTTTKGQLGTPYRFLGRKLVAQQLGKKTLWKGGLYARFAEKLGPTKVTKMVWREDMADLILSLLRKNLLNKLKWHFKHSGQLVPCDSPHSKDIDGFENVSCVLYFGTLRTSADELQERALTSLKMVEGEAKYWAGRYNARMDAHMKQGAAHIHPVWYRGPLVPQLQPRIRFPSLEFKTTVWRDSRVAVYSLQDLLGEEMVGELMKGSKWEMEKCVIVKRGRHNVPLETMLMQSQAYVATAGP